MFPLIGASLAFWLVGPAVQLLALHPLMSSLLTVVTVACESTKLHRHWPFFCSILWLSKKSKRRIILLFGQNQWPNEIWNPLILPTQSPIVKSKVMISASNGLILVSNQN